MKTRISMLTCPGREKHAYRTMDAVLDSGAENVDEMFVFCDGEAHVGDFGPWETENLWSHKTGRGNLRAFHRVMVKASIDKVERHIFIEDDVRPCQGAIKRMLDVGVPGGLPFVSFFDMKEFYPGAPEGLYTVPLMGIDGRGFWGLQAVLFNQPLMTMAFIEPKSPGLRFFREQMNKHRSHSDMILAQALQKAGYDRYACHLPCLFEHVGHTDSSIWKFDKHDVSRKATNFPGETFNAQALRKP